MFVLLDWLNTRAVSVLLLGTLQLLQSLLNRSTFRNGYGNKKLRDMTVAGQVTHDNFLCNLCLNKIARQVARTLPSVTPA